MLSYIATTAVVGSLPRCSLRVTRHQYDCQTQQPCRTSYGGSREGIWLQDHVAYGALVAGLGKVGRCD